MSDFTEVLQLKIQELEDEIEEYEDSISRMKAKIETLNELLEESPEPKTTKPLQPVKVSTKPRGRPKGSRNKKKVIASKGKTDTSDEDGRVVLTEAEQSSLGGMEGTDPEIARRLSSRKFAPKARPMDSYGPGVRPDPEEDYGKRKSSGGGKKKSSDTPKSHTNITIEDEE